MTPNNRNIVGHYPLGMSEEELLLYDPNLYALWRTDGFDKEMFQSDDSGKYGVLSNNMIFSQAWYYPQLAAVAQTRMNRIYGPDTWNTFNHTNAKRFGEAGYFGETTSNYNNSNMENNFDASASAAERHVAREIYSQLMYGMPLPKNAIARRNGSSNYNGYEESPLTKSLISGTTNLTTATKPTTTTIAAQETTSSGSISIPTSVSPTSTSTSTSTSSGTGGISIPTSVSPTSTSSGTTSGGVSTSPTTTSSSTTTTTSAPRSVGTATTYTSLNTSLGGTTTVVSSAGSIPRPLPGTSVVATTTPSGTTVVENVGTGTTTISPAPMGGPMPMGGGGGGGMEPLPDGAGAKEAGAEGAGAEGAGGGGAKGEEMVCKLNYMPILIGGLILGGAGYFYAKNKKMDIKKPLVLMTLMGAVLGYLYSKHQCKPIEVLSKIGVKSKSMGMAKQETPKAEAKPTPKTEEKKFCGCGA